MQSNQRRLRRLRSHARAAVVIPTALLAMTAFVSPSFADDAAPDDSGSPAAEPAPAPEPEPAPAPAPDPEPAPEPKPAPAPAAEPAAEPAPAEAEPAEEAAVEEPPADAVPAGEGAKPSASAIVAQAAAQKKVVVCKYVGTPPGTPHHIIVVAKAAIGAGSKEGIDGDPHTWDESTFPWYFSDAHDSVAIRWAIGNEQPGNEELVNCPGYSEDDPDPEPFVIDPPEIKPDDPCGPDNASYPAIPETDQYTVEGNEDLSVTLTAKNGYIFPDEQTTYTLPAPVDSGEECEVEGNKVVVCKYVSTPPGDLHQIIIVNENAIGAGTNELGGDEPDHAWDGMTFPWYFADAHASVAIRYAEDGEQAKDVPLAECPSESEPDPYRLPVLTVDPQCGPANDTWHVPDAPEGEEWPFDVVVNEDRSLTVTLTVEGLEFPGGGTVLEVPAPDEVNSEPCVEVLPSLVACTLPSDASGDEVVESEAPQVAKVEPTVQGILSFLGYAIATAAGWDGATFPFEFEAEGQLVRIIRLATEADTEESIAAEYAATCQVGGIIEEDPEDPEDPVDPTDPTDPGEVGGITDLPDTGGPMGWLFPVGLGFVLAGGLLVTRRPRRI